MMVDRPRYPDWAPAYVTEEIVQLVNTGDDRDASPAEMSTARNLASMWERLVTRAEMELFWKWYESLECPHPQHQKNTIVFALNWQIAQFETGPRLSAKEYRAEMLAIEKMALDLSKRLRKFRGSSRVTANLFTASAMLTHEDIGKVGGMIRSEILTRPLDDQLLTGPLSEIAVFRRRREEVDEHFPAVVEQLENWAAHAQYQAKSQFFRLRLPRKINDKNVFRTYLVGLVQDFLFGWHDDYSPSRIATFCSVALDDDRIDPDLVSKLCKMRQATRE